MSNSGGRRGSIFGGSLDPYYGGSPREALEEAKEQLEAQNAQLQRIMAGPTTRGFVVEIMKDDSVPKALISVSQQLVEVGLPRESYVSKLDIGSVVRVQVDTLAILGLIDSERATGDIAFVRDNGKNGECEVDWHGNTRMIRYGSKFTPEAGDRIMVDATCNVGFRNLGPDLSKFSFEGDTNITWDDIGGLLQAKEDMQEALELPHQHQELYKSYNKKPVKGVMLYGPAGCGKTLLAKAAVTSIMKRHGAQAQRTGFISVKGPELLDKFIGVTEAQIRSLFARGRTHFKKHGYPAIMFIDEADALLGKRGARLNMGTETTVVPQFLSEMDGLENSGVIVILATNRPDTLDPAVTRDGRIDRKVKVTRPTRDGTEEILRLYLNKVPLADKMKPEQAARKAADMIFNPGFELYDVLMKDKSKKSFTLGQLVNGAMAAGMVDTASTRALRRDAKAGRKSSTGVSIDDLQDAADKLYIANRDTNHEVELEEFCSPFENDVDKITKPQPKKSLIVA